MLSDYNALNIATGQWTGAYIGGVVTHSHTTFETLTTAQSAISNVSGAQAAWASGTYHPNPVNNTDAHTDYAFWERPEQALIYSQTNAAAGITTTLTYNGDGRLRTAQIADGRPRTVTYIDNALGQIISRTETSNTGVVGPREYYFNFAGMQRGDAGNNGKRVSDMDYAGAIAARQNAAQTGAFQGGARGKLRSVGRKAP